MSGACSAADVLLESIERVRDAAAVLGAQLVGWDTALDHRHLRPAVGSFERELGLEPKGRTVQARFGG